MLADRYNFRDLGGYKTTDGRRLRRGLVFRSASLAGMAEVEVAQLHALGIALVIDLRSRVERMRAPASHAIRTWFYEREHSAADLEAAWRQPGLTRSRAVALMTDVYRSLPEEQAEAYGMMFSQIAEETLPVLFHCSAGKDRTGVCAALLLELLGVPRATIEQDYMQTRNTVARAIEETRNAMKRLGVDISDEAVLDPILNVNPAYLAAMFAAIKHRYGSTARYFEKRLSLNSSQVAQIRAALLHG